MHTAQNGFLNVHSRPQVSTRSGPPKQTFPGPTGTQLTTHAGRGKRVLFHGTKTIKNISSHISSDVSLSRGFLQSDGTWSDAVSVWIVPLSRLAMDCVDAPHRVLSIQPGLGGSLASCLQAPSFKHSQNSAVMKQNPVVCSCVKGAWWNTMHEP